MFEGYRFTLASGSPRRKELLTGLGLPFRIEVGKDEKEAYSDNLPHGQIPEFLARHKSESFHRPLEDGEILITADTLVFKDGEILGKPKDRQDAFRILSLLSDATHTVKTGVCIRSSQRTVSFTDTTEVTFRKLSEDEIYHYIDCFKPYDKAGAYGIQEWIGYIGITGIKGSYFNVIGLPVQMLYDELIKFCK